MNRHLPSPAPITTNVTDATCATDATTRRSALVRGGTLALLLAAPHIARGAGIIAVRVWPAEDYTRVTIESDTRLKTSHQMVESPPRLAVDIHGLQLDATLRALVAKVRPDDPNIAGIRVGQYTPDTVRLVFDLKRSSSPQVFNLAPVAAYSHRLVFDLYPANPPDPLEQLIAQRLKELDAPSAPSAPTTPATGDPLGTLIGQLGNKPAPTRPATISQPSTTRKPTTSTTTTTATVANPQQATRPTTATATTPSTTRATSTTQPHTTTAQQRTDRIIIIALDPGHGGEDPGAIGPGGTREKDVVLSVARLLAARINSTSISGHALRAWFTRSGDYFVPLGTRVAKARRVGADLFISIHADAFTRPEAHGASVYALSERGASSTAARWIANKENASDQIGGVNINARDAQVQRALLDMSTASQIKSSLALGGAIIKALGAIGDLHKKSVERANFAVLRAPDIPSVLVETAFISNPQEERKLRTTAYQEKLANAILSGIRSYFAAHPPKARSRQV